MKCLTLDDITTGVLAGLTLNGTTTLHTTPSGTNLRLCFSKIYPDIKNFALQYDLKLNFEIIPQEIHEDSSNLRDAIYGATARGLLKSSHNEIMRINLTPDNARAKLDELPGSPDLYISLARKFIEQYRSY